MIRFETFFARALALLLAAALSACGGGGGSGVGSGGTGASASSAGVASGPVTGFGSVIVGDTRFDDGSATVTFEDQPGSERNGKLSDLRLGQQVTIGFNDDGTTARASTLRVEAEVVGVIQTGFSGSSFTVAGQTVVVNTDPTKGPVTILDGFASTADLIANTRVEVHGQRSPTGIQATRIEREVATDTFVRVAGTVSGLSGSTFTLGTITVNTASATVLPSGTTLANGQRVVVYSANALSGGTLTAQTIRVVRGETQALQARLSGLVANCSPPASAACRSSFTVNGIGVDASNASFSNGNLSNLVDGAFVRIRGTFNATTGRVVATSVTFKASGETEVEVRGAINDFLQLTAPTDKTFLVRSVPVSTNSSTSVTCGSTALANGVLVKVEGSVSGSTVIASRVTCVSSTEVEGSEIESKGLVTSLTGASSTLTIDSLSSLPIRWSSSTQFETGFSASNLTTSAYIEVKGQLVNGVVVAREINFENAPSGGEQEIRGILFNYAGGATFQVGTLTINVNGQTIPSGFVNGAKVRVKYVISGAQYNATEIRLDDG